MDRGQLRIYSVDDQLGGSANGTDDLAADRLPPINVAMPTCRGSGVRVLIGFVLAALPIGH